MAIGQDPRPRKVNLSLVADDRFVLSALEKLGRYK
jgi:hypothetical protein